MEPSASSGRITRITSQRRNSDRVNIFVDDIFACGAAYEVLAGEKLRLGDTLHVDVLERLRAADASWKAKQAALSLLAVRVRTRGELIDRLRRKGFNEHSIRYAMDEAERLDLIDDDAFADAWVSDRIRLRPRGSRALVAELGRKRIPAEKARAAVARVMRAENTADEELCMNAAMKWIATGRNGEGEGARTQRRLTAFLARRGFDGDAVRSAVRAALTVRTSLAVRRSGAALNALPYHNAR